jgi:hypothetical protein
MKTLIIFLLGLVIGGVATLFLPNTRRDEFNAEIRTQTGVLQAHLQQFGDQFKGAKQPKIETNSPTPAPRVAGRS